MNAIRTVSETDDVHIIEGIGFAFGGPFHGRDSYGTFASARTNFHWDLFPDCAPDQGTRSAEPRFIRPVNYQHGFDPELGLSRVGGWSPIRADDRGVWVRAQLDKHHAYYEAIRELLDKEALAFSPESAEHSVRFDQRTGEWLDWPAIALALTPTPANPLNQITARTADTLAVLRIIAARGWLPDGTTEGDLDDGDFAWLADDKSLPDSERRKLPYKIHGEVNEDGWRAAWTRAHQDGTDFSGGPSREEVIARLLRDKPAGVEVDDSSRSATRAYSEAASDAAMGAGALGTLLYLLSCEADEPDQVAIIQRSIDALEEWLNAERAEVGTPEDMAESMQASMAYYSAMRAGRRNSAEDQGRIDQMHDLTVALGASAHAGDGLPDDETNQAGDKPDAARTGDPLPAVLRIVERPDPEAVRAALTARANEIGEQIAKQRLRL